MNKVNKKSKKPAKTKSPPKGTLKITAFFTKSPSKPKENKNLIKPINDEPIVINDDSLDSIISPSKTEESKNVEESIDFASIITEDNLSHNIESSKPIEGNYTVKRINNGVSKELTDVFNRVTNSNSSPLRDSTNVKTVPLSISKNEKACANNCLLPSNDNTSVQPNCKTLSMKVPQVTQPQLTLQIKDYGKRKSITRSNENDEFSSERSPVKEDLKKSRQLRLEHSPNVSKDLFDDFMSDWDEINVESEYTLNIQDWTHCVISDISSSANSKTIFVKSSNSEETTSVTLLGAWKECKMDIGDKIYIQAKSTPNYITPFCLDNHSGFLVYEPEVLVSGTSVVSALFCQRRAVLSSNIRSSDTSSASIMFIGSLVHQLLQISLRDRLCTENEIKNAVENIFSNQKIIFELYANNMQLEKTKMELQQFVPKILKFLKQHVKSSIPLTTAGFDSRSNVVIDTIEDIEENIWCHKLGIKGKVDVSIKSCGNTLPLELKTGRASGSLEHRGQVMLYTMMMRQLGYSTSSGLLLYLRENVMQEVKCNYREERDLILLRNDLVYFLQKQSNFVQKTAQSANENAKEDSKTDPLDERGKLIDELRHLEEEFEALKLLPPELPDPINHHSACGRCAQNTICCALLKKEIPADNPLATVKQEKLKHLKSVHLKYFTNWYSIIYLEETYKRNKGKDIKDIYTLPPEEREKRGKSLIYMALIPEVTKLGDDWIHKFKKSSSSQDILKCGFSEGGYLVVSTSTRPAVAAGYITEITSESISLSLERNLLDKYKKCSNFHLDSYEGANSLTFNLSSLALLLEDNERAQRFREIVIERKVPVFEEVLPSSILKHGRKILRKLNKVQSFAVLKALSAHNYLLIKGMPGTGKTQTIICLIQMLVALKFSVLITSHTHSAVDNVCLRLESVGVKVVRLGSLSRTDPRLLHRSEHTLTKDFTSPEQFEEFYNNAQVLAVTCMGSNHIALSKRTMDVCIVDESTQVLQTSIIRPLLSSKKFFLIGDPDQLPPVVRNPEAVMLGMKVSLFSLLHSSVSTVTLTRQYRMNKTITDLANVLTYGGQLLTANDDVANNVLKLNASSKIFNPNERWLERILDCKLKAAVNFIDTGPIWEKTDKISILPPTLSEKEHGSCFNVYEVVLINCIVANLLEAGLEFDSIGIIATYRAQVDLLLNVLPSAVEVSTVDQYQGRDKDVIIYSCTKSSSKSVENYSMTRFDVLEDNNRLTVAITRAKAKLILVGDVKCLNRYTPFRKLFQGIKDENMIQLKDETDFSWTNLLNSVSY